jgi:hypothetical protein
VTQVLVQSMGLPDTPTTWEDYEVLRHRFAFAPAWRQAVSLEGGIVTTTQLAASASWFEVLPGRLLWALVLSERMWPPIS